MSKSFIFLFISTFLFFSCKKKDACIETTNLNISAEDATVYEGFPITLYADNYTYSHVQISGPNGYYKIYQDGDYFSGIEVIESPTVANTGTYYIEYWQNDCLVERGSIYITVLPTPTPPCSMNDNTGSSNIIGISPQNYDYVYGEVYNSYYVFYGAASTRQLNIRFNGTSEPVSGKYKVNGSYYPEEGSDNCAVYLQTSLYDFFAMDDQEVYVTRENNKLVVTLCDVQFHNSVSSSDLFISAKLVKP